MPMPIQMREIAQPQFDTIYLPSQLDGHSARGFLYPLGMSVPVKYGSHVKTENDTNMIQQSTMPAPCSFLVEGIECYLVDDEGIIPAKSRWYAESNIAFFRSGKLEFQSPIAKCAGMAAITNMDKQSLITMEDFTQLRAESKLKTPVEVRQQECFSVKASFSDWCMNRWENRTAPSKLCVYLNGLLRQPEY